jgi:DNA-binding NarL/FixJ family response regulator
VVSVTDSEKFWIQLLANGETAKSAAPALNKSHRTLENWTAVLLKKFKARTRPELVAKAMREKIIQ